MVPSDEEAKLSWLGRFKNADLERAYTRYYVAQHGTRRAVSLQMGLVLVSIAVVALYVGIHEMCRPCADVVVTVCLASVFAIAALQLALRFVLRPVPLIQEIAVVLWGIIFGVSTVLSVHLCVSDGFSSSSSSLPSSSLLQLSSSSSSPRQPIWDHAYLPPPTLLSVFNSFCIFCFLAFGCVTWPRSLIAGCVSWVIELVGFIAVIHSHPTLIPTQMVLLGAIVYILFSAAISSQEHRKDFATMLKLERELGAATAQKEATKSIVHAMFPTNIAERLMEARYMHTTTLHSEMTSTTIAMSSVASLSMGSPSMASMGSPSMASMGSPSMGSVASPSMHPADVEMAPLNPGSVSSSPDDPSPTPRSKGTNGSDVVVDKFASASVVCVSFDGLESIKPADVQLDVLSKLFIAAERVAATRGAVKVKSIGTDMLFVCGTVKSDGAHTENACKLAIDLQRMLAGFQKERSISCISLRGSVVTGPVAAGVIGIARPKYDVWGFTVSVAEKLCQVAGQGRLLVTRDVAKAEQSHFKFQAVRQLAIVQGIGKILPFLLVPAANLEPIFPNCAPAEFSLPKPKVLELSDVAKTLRKRRKPKMSAVTLRFADKGTEARFLPVHIAKFLPHLRWISLIMLAFFLYFYIRSILNEDCDTLRHITSNISYGLLLVLFILTWTPLRKKPKAFLRTISIILFFFVVDSILLLDLQIWSDATVSGLLATVMLLGGIKTPSWITLGLSVLLHLSTFFVMLFVIGYKLDSLLSGLAWTVIAFVGQRDWEESVRGNFVLNTALVQNEEKTLKEKEAAQGLLESVVPLQVLQKMESVDLHAQASFFSEFIPASTTLTCTVVGFDALYRQMEPVEIVKLLNALFSHFDTLAQARGVVPLKTIADEYVVVGNMLREMEEDHAKRVVGLAVDMVRTLARFNTTHNPTHFPVNLRIGIHSSAVLSGVIRTKSFAFDCWGAGVPVAEQIMFAAAPNVVLVSSSTMELLGDSFAAMPLGPLPLEGATGAEAVIQVFGVSGEVDQSKHMDTTATAPSDAIEVVSCDTAAEAPKTPETPTSKSQPPPKFGDVDYGVYLGSIDFTATSPSSHPRTTSMDSGASSSSAASSSSPVVLDPQFVPVEEDDATATAATMQQQQPIEAADAGLHFVPVEDDGEQQQHHH